MTGGDPGPGEPFISTGALPEPRQVQAWVESAHRAYAKDRDGSPSNVYPALARVEPDQFGICVVGAGGRSYTAGDVDNVFALMSVSKPFVFALVCGELGSGRMRDLLGANGTGLAFNSLEAIERSGDGRTNPMVNPGAIAASSLVPGSDLEEKWAFVQQGLSRFAGRELELDEEILTSALETNSVNRAIASLLASRGRIYCDPAEAITLYTRQCSLATSARDLAAMGATLACGGVNPMTGRRVVAGSVCHHTLAVMVTAGMYETSGDWLYDVGLPGKSGIGGGIVTVSPGKGGMGSFGPRLDDAGNSVKGQLAAAFLSQKLGLDLLTSSAPATADP